MSFCRTSFVTGVVALGLATKYCNCSLGSGEQNAAAVPDGIKPFSSVRCHVTRADTDGLWLNRGYITEPTGDRSSEAPCAPPTDTSLLHMCQLSLCKAAPSGCGTTVAPPRSGRFFQSDYVSYGDDFLSPRAALVKNQNSHRLARCLLGKR